MLSFTLSLNFDIPLQKYYGSEDGKTISRQLLLESGEFVTTLFVKLLVLEAHTAPELTDGKPSVVWGFTGIPGKLPADPYKLK